MSKPVLFLGGPANGEYRVVERLPYTVITPEDEPAHYYEANSQNKDAAIPIRKTKYVQGRIGFPAVKEVLIVAVPESYGRNPEGVEALFYHWVISRLGK